METAQTIKTARKRDAYASPGFPDNHASLHEAPRRWPAMLNR